MIPSRFLILLHSSSLAQALATTQELSRNLSLGKKIPSLAVFDFDHTIVNDDCYNRLLRKLPEISTVPNLHRIAPKGLTTWIPFMTKVFEHAYWAGMRPKDVLRTIASMKPTEGIEELFRILHANGWDILVLTDANSVFVEHWLQSHKLRDCVTDIITNNAYWLEERLYIEPCMTQTSCLRCPSNLCKSEALAQWLRPREPYGNIVYVGDGRNDFCPAISLSSKSVVFPRRDYPLDRLIQRTLKSSDYQIKSKSMVFPRHDYPLDRLIQKTLKSSDPQIKAKVVPWTDCFKIIETLFPNKCKNGKLITASSDKDVFLKNIQN